MSEPEFVLRTRSSYDALADDYAEWIDAELAAKPLDRALLDAFAELVRAAGSGPVADLGCGSGRLTAYLDRLGLPVFGIDLSPRMVTVARSRYPDLRFDEGSILDLDIPDGSLGGIVAWYSIIHIPAEHLPGVFAEFHRILAPGGYLQLAFQAGDELAHRTQAGAHRISLDFHHRRPGQIAELVAQAELPVHAQMLRAPDNDGDFPEDTPQAFVLARRPPHPNPPGAMTHAGRRHSRAAEY